MASVLKALALLILGTLPTPGDAGDGSPGRAEIQRFTRESNAWRIACVGRLKTHWRSRLRRTGYSRVTISSWQRQTFAKVRIVAVQRGTRLEVQMGWDPGECDAGGATAWHTIDSQPPSQFLFSARQAKWPTLDQAANDCFALQEFRSD
jgi:hypothetical protein